MLESNSWKLVATEIDGSVLFRTLSAAMMVVHVELLDIAHHNGNNVVMR